MSVSISIMFVIVSTKFISPWRNTCTTGSKYSIASQETLTKSIGALLSTTLKTAESRSVASSWPLHRFLIFNSKCPVKWGTGLHSTKTPTKVTVVSRSRSISKKLSKKDLVSTKNHSQSQQKLAKGLTSATYAQIMSIQFSRFRESYNVRIKKVSHLLCQIGLLFSQIVIGAYSLILIKKRSQHLISRKTMG